MLRGLRRLGDQGLGVGRARYSQGSGSDGGLQRRVVRRPLQGGQSPSSSSPPISPLVSISLTASSNSGPANSSPISRPILRIARARLLGSFSSISPNCDESASASMRASSLRGIANRDIRRCSFLLPHFPHCGLAFSLTRRVRTLVRRWHASHSYS